MHSFDCHLHATNFFLNNDFLIFCTGTGMMYFSCSTQVFILYLLIVLQNNFGLVGQGHHGHQQDLAAVWFRVSKNGRCSLFCFSETEA